MKTKTIIITVIVIFLIVFVTAQILSVRNITIELTKGNKTILELNNITNPQTTNLTCYGDICEYKMYQLTANGTLLLGRHELNCSGLTDVQCGKNQGLQIEEWLEEYAVHLAEEKLQNITRLGKLQIQLNEEKTK